MNELFRSLGIDSARRVDGDLSVVSPIDGSCLARLRSHDEAQVARAIEAAQHAFVAWRSVPAPKRGELIRLFGDELRASKELLGRLITIETGKILAEGLGEVQEMIDICDFALGLSRQLYGLTMPSERPGHRMMETWHPLGVVGVVSAFNFPAAVWAWNAALAVVCGDAVIWKPSEKTPLTALACQAVFEKAARRFAQTAGAMAAPAALSQVLVGGRETGQALVDHPSIALLSATGSTRMGREIGVRVAARLGRCLLELGGNNAMIVAPSADLDLALRAILFSAVGTAGQRCTTLRRLIVHREVLPKLLPRLRDAYRSVPIGDPLEARTLVGPLIDRVAFENMQSALSAMAAAGARVNGGERVLSERFPDAYYVRPAIVEVDEQNARVREETFAPILYVLPYEDFDQAIAIQNDVPQGLSSCVFTNDLREAEKFLSAAGSDCGIANVNIGPSGAEIGGAFGGEKETGGGREAGSDAWRNYMRRATNTVNHSRELPLAQGISFDAIH
ncbi:MAG: aldehyde dehydrogenase family protein [Burkholderiaceae bacterium]|nr:aldehyde dehydrogenase family protein [Burkholderiaceae bacterium]